MFTGIGIVAAVSVQFNLLWSRNKNNNEANQWKANRKNATITAYDQENNPVVEWTFVNCYPTSYTLPDFTAGGNDVALEVVDIVYEGVKRVQ